MNLDRKLLAEELIIRRALSAENKLKKSNLEQT